MAPPPDPIHLRYERTTSGRARIDISVESADRIYNRFDEPVAYPNRNLDPAVVQYLVECATELDPEPFEVWFHVEELPEGEVAEHARQSLARYFEYRVALEWRLQEFEIRRSLILFAAGGSLLTGVTWASVRGLHLNSVAMSLAVQGLTVASWLLLWESFGAWFLRWSPQRHRIRVYRKLASAEVTFLKR